MKLKKTIFIFTIQLIILSINFVFSASNINKESQNSTNKHKKSNFPYFNHINYYFLKKDITSFSINIQFLLKNYNNKNFLELFKTCFLNKKYQVLSNIKDDINLKLLNLVEKSESDPKKMEPDTKESLFGNLYEFINLFRVNGIMISKGLKRIELENGKLRLDLKDKKNNENYKTKEKLEYKFKTLDDYIIEKYNRILDLMYTKDIKEENKRIIEFSRYLINNKNIFENFDYDDNSYLLEYNEISKELVEKYNEIIEIGLQGIEVDKLTIKYMLIYNDLKIQIGSNYDNMIDINELTNLMQLINKKLQKFHELLKRL